MCGKMFKNEIAQNNQVTPVNRIVAEFIADIRFAYPVWFRRTRLYFAYITQRGKWLLENSYRCILHCFLFFWTKTFDSEKENERKEANAYLRAISWRESLVDSFEGGVFLKRARGHQNNFIVGHVKGTFDDGDVTRREPPPACTSSTGRPRAGHAPTVIACKREHIKENCFRR